VFEQNQKIERGMWDMEHSVILTAQITDTVNPHNVYVNFRNAGTYPFSNIFLFVNTRFPNGQMDRDTVEVMLATPEGKWMGMNLVINDNDGQGRRGCLQWEPGMCYTMDPSLFANVLFVN
jgi:gliding motility-associated lipoprotein GldH